MMGGLTKASVLETTLLGTLSLFAIYIVEHTFLWSWLSFTVQLTRPPRGLGVIYTDDKFFQCKLTTIRPASECLKPRLACGVICHPLGLLIRPLGASSAANG